MALICIVLYHNILIWYTVLFYYLLFSCESFHLHDKHSNSMQAFKIYIQIELFYPQKHHLKLSENYY